MVVKKEKETAHQKEVKEQRKIHKEILKEAREFQKQFAERLLKLVTSGFGLVSALAWNELIKEFVKEYVKPYFGESSGMISLFIYALIVTFLAVLVTYQLSRISKKED